MFMPIGEVLLWAEFSDSRRLSLEMKKPFQLSKTPHQLADVASLLRPFSVLRSSALAAVLRRAFFIAEQEAEKMKLKYNCPGCHIVSMQHQQT